MSQALASFVTNMTGGLSRLWCQKCKEESIHRAGVCIHCKTAHVAYPVKDLAAKWVSKSITIRRMWNGAKRK